jgi:hypothetical protein
MKYNFSKPITKRVMDKFFERIAKNGSLVTLDRGGKFPSLSSLFNKLGYRLFGAVFVNKGKYPSRLRQLYAFLVHLQNMKRHHGAAYVVKYLKVSQLAIQKAIAGFPVDSLNQLDSSLPFPYVARGLPKIIPVRDRDLILKNSSSSVIRWWLTLFSVYRVINIPSILKLGTITDGLTVSKESVDRVAEEIIKIINPSMFDIDSMRNTSFRFLEAASATTRVSWLGLLSDIKPLLVWGHGENLITLFRITGNYQLATLFQYLAQQLLVGGHNIAQSTELYHELGLDTVPIGKLSIKEEAAGKARVFAMVDVWTQNALAPIHDMLFKFLKTLPNDATFNQEAAVERCHNKCILTGCSFGYDLTAATDRLPISLQEEILEVILPGSSKP